MRTLPAAVVVVLAAIAATACQHGNQHEAAPGRSPSSVASHDNGISALPAKEIAVRAGRAIHNVPVHVRGTFSEASGPASTLDLIPGDGGDVRCTVAQGRESVDMVRVQGEDYVRASASTWVSTGVPVLSKPSIAQRADGKYVRAAMGRIELVRFTHLLEAGRILGDELPATETATKVGTAIINGVPTVAVTVVTPGMSPLPIGTVYVATVGEPYVLRWDSPGGRMSYTDYGKTAVIDPPPAAQVIDLDDLLHV